MRDFEADLAAWCARRKAEQQARRAARAVRMLGLHVRDPLPTARVWMHGPKWKRAFDVRHLPIADVAPESAKYHRAGRRFWWYDFTDDVRELVLDPIRPDVYAEWADPRERLPA